MSRLCLIGVAIGFVLIGLRSADAQTSPKAAMLEQAGWQALTDGDAQAAAEAFREAIALDPKNARLRLGAGTAAFLQRRDADAKAALEVALALDPKLTRARAQLGQLLRRGGDLPGAIRAYEIVVAEAPGDSRALETLERWRREADLHERMQLAVGDHFTVSFEGPEDQALAAEVLDSLNRAFWRIGDRLGVYPNASVKVVLYTAEQFRDITRSPPWAAGAYDGTIRLPMRGALSNRKELDRVVAHEFAHALIRSLATRGVPVWLNEGLATALEESGGLAWADARLRDAPEIPTLSDLHASFGQLTRDHAQLAYAASALAAERLLEEAGGAAVVNLLRDLGDGIDFETAFAHRVQRSFAEFQANLREPS